MRVVQVPTAELRKNLRALIADAAPGDVLELVDKRRKAEQIRAFIVIAAPGQEVTVHA